MFTINLPRITAVVVCIFWAALAVAQDSQSPFTGTFSGQGITLQLIPSTQGFSGTVQQAGQSYPVNAAKLGESLVVGTYQYQGQAIAFSAQLDGRNLLVTSEGQAILLERQVSSAGGALTAPEAAPAVTETEQPAASTASGGQNYDKAWGITFNSPSGWRVAKKEGLYLLVSDTKKGLMIVMPHEAKTRQELITGAREGLSEEGGTSLYLDGAPRNYGDNGIAANFQGFVEGQKAKAYSVAVISPYGTGAVILTAVDPDSYTKTYEEDVKSLAASIKFSKPVVPDFVGEWQRDLKGAKLTYMWSYSSLSYDGGYAGGSSTKEIELCPQGYFFYSSSNNMSVDAGASAGHSGAYSYGSGRGQGTWKVSARNNKPLLQLQFNDGRLFEYELEYKEKKTYLDGTRYFWTNLEAGRCN